MIPKAVAVEKRTGAAGMQVRHHRDPRVGMRPEDRAIHVKLGEHEDGLDTKRRRREIHCAQAGDLLGEAMWHTPLDALDVAWRRAHNAPRAMACGTVSATTSGYR